MGNINPSVDLAHDGDVAVITIDNPPVNALKHEVRAGIAEAIDKVRQDAQVQAVVLACAGRTFSAGADITEFGKPLRQPGLSDVIAAIEALDKPVVAALHGTTLGGGFELALGCHYRVAAPGTKVGLPEVKLGILPGGGGTQRLPRLVGPEKALRMIVSGEPISAREALDAGAIDAIVEGNPAEGAVEFARRVVAGGRKPELARDREDKIRGMTGDASAFDKAASDLTKKARGQRAPQACVEAVRNAFTLPFDEGLRRERTLFLELVSGDQSRAQRHVFFAEREAAKVPGIGLEVKPRQIRSAAVIGAGTMGGGIAMTFANASIPVTLIETSEEPLTRGLGTIRKNYENTAKRGGITADDVTTRVGLITGKVGLENAAEADIVIEAVFEEMDIKKKIFGDLDRIVKKGAVLATNTSTLDVDAIAAETSRPQDVLGMHYFSPANVMRLLEIVRGRETAPDAIATAVAVARKTGKVPVVVGVCYGFVGNRMLHQRTAESERLLLEGALPHEVDAALTEFGFPMGPFAMNDLAGVDVGWRIRRGRGERAEIGDTLAEAGRYGQKTGAGYFRYEAGNRTPIPDPDVEAIIVGASKRLGIERRRIDKQEILERLLYPMINEGARILEEGIASRPADIDVVWVYGYGWPVWRGGPMFYADSVGLAQIRDRLAHYASRSENPKMKPAPLLEGLAAEGKGFADWRGREASQGEKAA